MQSSPFVSKPSAPRGEMGRALWCAAGLVLLAGLAGCAHEPPLPDQYWRDHARLPQPTIQRTERETESIDAVVALDLARSTHVAIDASIDAESNVAGASVASSR